MKSLLPLVALVLLAGVVTGGEKQLAAPEVTPPANKSTAEPRLALQELDLSKLRRQRAPREIQDVFASPPPPAPPAPAVAPPSPPVVVAPQAPPAPVAPALPFKYLGRLDSAERSLVYLLRNQEMLTGVTGEPLDKDYRLDRVTDSAVHLTYLPLGTAQTLSIPAAP